MVHTFTDEDCMRWMKGPLPQKNHWASSCKDLYLINYHYHHINHRFWLLTTKELLKELIPIEENAGFSNVPSWGQELAWPIIGLLIGYCPILFVYHQRVMIMFAGCDLWSTALRSYLSEYFWVIILLCTCDHDITYGLAWSTLLRLNKTSRR